METGRGPWVVIEQTSGRFEHLLERGHEQRLVVERRHEPHLAAPADSVRR